MHLQSVSLKLSAIDGEEFANVVRCRRKTAGTFKLAAMNAAANNGELDEASLVKLYMDLTGASEASARSVYMFVNSEEKQKPNGLDRWRTEKTATQPSFTKVSATRTERDQEFGIGLFGNEGLAFTVA